MTNPQLNRIACQMEDRIKYIWNNPNLHYDEKLKAATPIQKNVNFLYRMQIAIINRNERKRLKESIKPF